MSIQNVIFLAKNWKCLSIQNVLFLAKRLKCLSPVPWRLHNRQRWWIYQQGNYLDTSLRGLRLHCFISQLLNQYSQNARPLLASFIQFSYMHAKSTQNMNLAWHANMCSNTCHRFWKPLIKIDDKKPSSKELQTKCSSASVKYIIVCSSFFLFLPSAHWQNKCQDLQLWGKRTLDCKK